MTTASPDFMRAVWLREEDCFSRRLAFRFTIDLLDQKKCKTGFYL